MNAATITKTLKKVNSKSLIEEGCSLGFRRLNALPQRVSFAFGLAAEIEANWDGLKANQNKKKFLESLTEREFIDWMKLQ